MNKHGGMARHVDSLGRVVIPKEIREKLHISFGDLLEFDITENTVVMQKCHVLAELKHLLESIIDLVKCCSDVEVYVFDTEDLIFANDKFCQKPMPQRLKSILQSRKECEVHDVEEIGKLVITTAWFFPLICRGDILGAILVTGEKEKLVGKNLQNILVTFFS